MFPCSLDRQHNSYTIDDCVPMPLGRVGGSVGGSLGHIRLEEIEFALNLENELEWWLG
jgi:hypothetical protein